MQSIIKWTVLGVLCFVGGMGATTPQAAEPDPTTVPREINQSPDVIPSVGPAPAAPVKLAADSGDTVVVKRLKGMVLSHATRAAAAEGKLAQVQKDLDAVMNYNHQKATIEKLSKALTVSEKKRSSTEAGNSALVGSLNEANALIENRTKEIKDLSNSYTALFVGLVFGFGILVVIMIIVSGRTSRSQRARHDLVEQGLADDNHDKGRDIEQLNANLATKSLELEAAHDTQKIMKLEYKQLSENYHRLTAKMEIMRQNARRMGGDLERAEGELAGNGFDFVRTELLSEDPEAVPAPELPIVSDISPVIEEPKATDVPSADVVVAHGAEPNRGMTVVDIPPESGPSPEDVLRTRGDDLFFGGQDGTDHTGKS